jgi:hypothetical protein
MQWVILAKYIDGMDTIYGPFTSKGQAANWGRDALTDAVSWSVMCLNNPALSI